MFIVCNIQQDMKFRFPMYEMKMLDITHEVYITFGFHKMRRISGLAENWLAFQEWLWSME
jgi:hypothetical protein